MKIRTFLVIALSLAALFATAWVFVTNRDVLDQEILLWSTMPVKIAWALVLSFVLGVLVVALARVAHDFSLMIDRNRVRRASRKSEEIEEEYSRGLVAVLEGRQEEALGHFRAVLERDSRHFNTLLKIGDVLRQQERHAEAIEYHRKAHHLKGDDTRPLYALVEDYEAKGDMDRARAVLGKIIGINKSSVAAWSKLRALHVKEHNWKQALEAHEKVVRLSGAEAATDARRFGLGIRYEMAASELVAGKPKETVAILRRLLKEDESFIPAHVAMGTALLQQGQEAEALQVWHHGFELTGSPIFLTVLEEHYLQKEQPLAAIEALKRCISKARKETLPRFYLGKLYFRLEMLDDAQSTLSSLEGVATYAPTLHYLLGRIHERRSNHHRAAQEYRRVIKEMDLVQLDYYCRACDATLMEWSHRCSNCGEWNSVEVNFREEISLEELGLAPAPIYTSRS